MTLTEICRTIVQWLGVPAEYRESATQVLLAVIDAIIIFTFLMVAVLVIVYAFRKIVGFIQARLGPRYTGPRGIFQTIADAISCWAKRT